MDNKICVITGGSGGIGSALGKKLENIGYEIIDLSFALADIFPNQYQCDISKKENVDKVFKEIGEKFGRIDLLINNAGYSQTGALEMLEETEIRRNFDVNALGMIFCTNAALPYMKEGAKIVTTSSVCGLFPLPFRNLYCASKAAVRMLTLGYRLELKRSGIDVCCICPGDVRTNFTKNREKNFKTSERYGDAFKNFTDKQDSRDHKRMSVDYVTNKMLKQIKRKKMKPQIIIGKKYKLFGIGYRLFPLSWFLWATNKLFNKPSKNK